MKKSIILVSMLSIALGLCVASCQQIKKEELNRSSGLQDKNKDEIRLLQDKNKSSGGLQDWQVDSPRPIYQ
jgi:hypothetical protein